MELTLAHRVNQLLHLLDEAMRELSEISEGIKRTRSETNLSGERRSEKIPNLDLYKRGLTEIAGSDAPLKVFDEVHSKNRGETPEELEKYLAKAFSEITESARKLRRKRAQGGH
jgi:DNA repair ATPase RecN